MATCAAVSASLPATNPVRTRREDVRTRLGQGLSWSGFVLITVRGRGGHAKKKKKTCAAVLMQNSQLDVSCIGCHCEKLFIRPSAW